MKKLLIVTNVDWFLISHRLAIAEEAVKMGWKVYVACEDTGRGNEIREKGIEFIDFKFSRSGTNIFNEIKTISRFTDLYKNIEPDVVHQITLKPVIYGSYAARRLQIKGVVNAISGLGYTFTAGRVGLIQKFILSLMRFGFNRPNVAVIFQNQDDNRLLSDFKILSKKNQLNLIKGSGVNLQIYKQMPFPPFDKIKILLPSRMLWDKGIKELREASEILKNRFGNTICFILAGLADDQNKAGVPASYLNEWADGVYVKWIGNQCNMIEVYANCHIVVLPSYREGLPKSLIEACATGRVIVTTDAIGCRDCVDEGVNGYKVPLGDSVQLATALEKLILNPQSILEMGTNGRRKAEQEFDIHDVVNKHLEIYNSLLD